MSLETNVVRRTLPPLPLTPDRKAAQTMMRLLEEQDEHGALRMARELMDCSDQYVRLQVIDVMSWLGKPAFPELVELMEHSDVVTAEAALSAWEQGFSRLSTDGARVTAVHEALKAIRSAKAMEAVLLQLSACKESTAAAALRTWIASDLSLLAKKLSREMYAHLTGEEWVSDTAR